MLYLLTDNGVQTVEYFINNGVYPTKYALQSESIREVAPYLCKDDTVVILSQGLINWSFLRLTNLLSDIYDAKDILKDLKVYSNIELPVKNFEYPYTLVKGDLFYGEFVDIDNGKKSKPYKSNLSEILRGYDKPVKPMCFDIDVSDSEDDEIKVIRVDSNSVTSRLIAVDVRKCMNKSKENVKYD